MKKTVKVLLGFGIALAGVYAIAQVVVGLFLSRSSGVTVSANQATPSVSAMSNTPAEVYHFPKMKATIPTRLTRTGNPMLQVVINVRKRFGIQCARYDSHSQSRRHYRLAGVQNKENIYSFISV